MEKRCDITGAPPAVVCRSIHKSYKGVKALTNLSLEISKGELFGLIGPDGSGKTTLFRILTSLIPADSGTAEVAGWDVVRDYRQLRTQMGYMPGRFSLYPDLTVAENLQFFATVFNTTVAENYHLIREVFQQLEPFKNRRAGKLSGGMKQKLALSCALIHKPAVLFLDEPTTGVDPVSRKEFWEMLRRLKNEGISILVSTPYMDEANRCDRIALMQHGEILSVETPAQMRAQFPKKIYRLEVDRRFGWLEMLRKAPEVESAFLFGEALHVVFRSDADALAFRTNAPALAFTEIRPEIEDCFIYLMNKTEK
ncbi:MAG: ABC transporter ATP-binding protein [Dysgonamonadaceae bacterium]|jgi:ABC-type multidrug transport system ATPase subunit|nr:ABC transporter ATP-binding protein [Dysgonamonadaceae bacterium]